MGQEAAARDREEDRRSGDQSEDESAETEASSDFGVRFPGKVGLDHHQVESAEEKGEEAADQDSGKTGWRRGSIGPARHPHTSASQPAGDSGQDGLAKVEGQ